MQNDFANRLIIKNEGFILYMSARQSHLLCIMAVIFTVTTMIPATSSAEALPVRSIRECRDPTPAETLDEMFAAIFACWVPPEASTGKGVTLQFMLLRDGKLKGKIVIAWVKPQNDSAARQEFVNSAIEAVQRAVPIPLGEALQRSVPGRVLKPRFSLD
jgi:hypothetical protein